MNRRPWLTLTLAATLLTGCGTSSSNSLADSGLPPAPSPAGPSVVVAQDGNLVRLDAQGQNLRPLTQGFEDQSPAFSPDGTWLIFSRSPRDGSANADLYRIRASDGSGLINLTADVAPSAHDPSYSPDGRQIAFAGRVGRDFDLYLMNADGTGARTLTSGPDEDRRPTFSPDGQTVVFERGGQLCSVPLPGGAVSPLAEGAFPSYAPGQSLLFTRGGDLWSWRAGLVSQLTDTPQAEFQGRSGGDVVYALATESGQPAPQGDLYLMNPDGANPRRLTQGLRASSLAVSPPAPSSSGVPLTVINNSPYPMYLYVFGYDPANNFTPSYLNTDGTVQAYTSGTIPAIATVASNTTSPAITMPLLNKARIYFSSNGNLTFTAFEESPSLNDGSQLYDFVEYDYISQGGTFTADTSCVEAFALPFKIETSPAGTVNGLSVAAGMEAGARTQIFTAMKNLGAPWANLIVGNNTRILAPWHGDLATPPFPADYLNPSIALQWGGNLTLNTYLQNPPQYYVAQAANGGNWTFAPQSGGGANVTYTRPPTSTEAFSCNFPFTSTDQGLGSRLTAILAAGLNRGTLLYPNPSPAPIPFTPVTPGQPDFSPVDFYKPGPTPPQVPQVNQYANILHQFSISNYQYGFASDDQGSQSSTLTVPSGIQSFTVTISSF